MDKGEAGGTRPFFMGEECYATTGSPVSGMARHHNCEELRVLNVPGRGGIRWESVGSFDERGFACCVGEGVMNKKYRAIWQ